MKQLAEKINAPVMAIRMTDPEVAPVFVSDDADEKMSGESPENVSTEEMISTTTQESS